MKCPISVQKSRVWEHLCNRCATGDAPRIRRSVPAVLTDALKAFVGNRILCYVFETDSGRPLSSRDILRDGLDKTLAKISSKQVGLAFHSFRRFRVTHSALSQFRKVFCASGLVMRTNL
jgi:hypothetical protein